MSGTRSIIALFAMLALLGGGRTSVALSAEKDAEQTVQGDQEFASHHDEYIRQNIANACLPHPDFDLEKLLDDIRSRIDQGYGSRRDRYSIDGYAYMQAARLLEYLYEQTPITFRIPASMLDYHITPGGVIFEPLAYDRMAEFPLAGQCHTYKDTQSAYVMRAYGVVWNRPQAFFTLPLSFCERSREEQISFIQRQIAEGTIKVRCHKLGERALRQPR